MEISVTNLLCLFTIWIVCFVPCRGTMPECPEVDGMCANMDSMLELSDLLEPGSQCPAFESEDLVDPEICLNIDEILSTPESSVTVNLRQTLIETDGTAQFVCSSDPLPYAIHWFWNWRRIPLDTVFRFSDVVNGTEAQTTLHVFHVAKHYGEYTCRVFTTSGVAQASAILKSPDVPEPCTLAFAQKPENRLVKINDYFNLNCMVTSRDKVAVVTWYKDIGNGRRKKVKANNNIKIVSTGLIVGAANRQHDATFICEITSGASCTIRANATVRVYSRLSEVCGESRDLDTFYDSGDEVGGKIFGGTEVDVGFIPWQVSLQRVQGGHMCGAVVLDKEWLLTAAHCFVLDFREFKKKSRFNKINGVLKFGIQILNKTFETKETQVRQIQEIILHPQLQRQTFDKDFALIKLRRSLKFNDYVRPICLPVKNGSFLTSLSEASRMGLVSGWGNGSENRLSAAKLEIQSEATCSQSTGRLRITENMFCAGEGRHGSSKACKGDSGGPFSIRNREGVKEKWYLAGIVSWGKLCTSGDEHQHGFYAKVSSVTSWILQKLGISLHNY